jgi:hypothetical protein
MFEAKVGFPLMMNPSFGDSLRLWVAEEAVGKNRERCGVLVLVTSGRVGDAFVFVR